MTNRCPRSTSAFLGEKQFVAAPHACSKTRSSRTKKFATAMVEPSGDQQAMYWPPAIRRGVPPSCGMIYTPSFPEPRAQMISSEPSGDQRKCPSSGAANIARGCPPASSCTINCFSGFARDVGDASAVRGESRSTLFSREGDLSVLRSRRRRCIPPWLAGSQNRIRERTDSQKRPGDTCRSL